MKTYTKWDKFSLPPLQGQDYGINWPKAMSSQLAKELSCFKACRMGSPTSGMQSALIHFLNIQRLLFPKKIELFKDTARGRVWNNYYLDVAEILTDFSGTGQDRTGLTGPASANKTYCAASYVFTSFLCAPGETLAMVSTTSGAASERRIWADIKDFHGDALYEENSMPKVGEVIEYLKSIVFDKEKELGSSDKNRRDFRNGIQVIPIATDSDGEAALTTIQGSKNRFVIWCLDEMAQMNEGVTRPLGNLGQNPHFHFIGIGNANQPDDPHAKYLAPRGGIESLNLEFDRRWEASNGAQVLFLHGDESPNNHPNIDQSAIKKVTDYPFPYASNALSSNLAAKEYGNGNIAEGKETADYWKFCIGFWPPSSANHSIYTKNLFTSYNCHLKGPDLVAGVRGFGSGDFAFSGAGDSNEFMHAKFGFDASGNKIVTFDTDTTTIRSRAQDKNEFIKQIANGFVTQIQDKKIKYSDFGGDTGNDASLTFTEMSKLAKTYDFVGISSNEAPGNKKKYVNRVTELWFAARDLIKTGCVRGINFESKYYRQLIERKYSRVGKKYEIEKKRDMKKRLGSSPDAGDCFIYLCWMIIRSGLFEAEINRVREVKTADEEYEEEREMARGPIFDPRRTQDEEEEDREFSQLTDWGDDEADYFSL